MSKNLLYIGRIHKLDYNYLMQTNQSALKNMNAINRDITGIYPIKAINKELSRAYALTQDYQDKAITPMVANLTRNLLEPIIYIKRNEIGMTSDRKQMRSDFDGEI